MDISFAKKALEKQANDLNLCSRKMGEPRATIYHRRLGALRAAHTLEDMRHMTGRFHMLTGKRKGYLNTLATALTTMKTSRNQYHQPVAFHPGETLREKLDELDMSLKEFALRVSKPEKTVIAVLNGSSSLTPEMAVQFEHVLKIPAHVWMNLQSNFDEYRAREQRKEQLRASATWAKKFPLIEMMKMGWLPKATTIEEKTEALCEFFGMSGPQAWKDYYLRQELKVAFRISLKHAKEPHAISAWLRKGELQAEELQAQPYRVSSFKEALERVREIMAEHPADFLVQLQDTCLAAGVKVVYTPCVKKAPLNGCARWLHDTPLIQLSGRHKRNDVFWFSFFHEAGHILLHGKKDVFLEGDNAGRDETKEAEADAFAVKWVFPIEAESELLVLPRITTADILEFAHRYNTHPAMILGRLQHKGILKQSFGKELFEKIELE